MIQKMKRGLSLILAFCMLVTGMQFVGGERYGAAQAADRNLALDATVTASNTEEGTGFTPDKVKDGRKSGSGDIRWGTDKGNSYWLQMAWNEAVDLRFFFITWQRRTAQSLKIQISNDGNSWTDAWSRTQNSDSLLEKIDLGQTKRTKYVKFVMENILATDPDNIVSGWNNVSVYEIEAYAKLPENMARYAVPTAESNETANLVPEFAADGDRRTKWGSAEKQEGQSSWFQLQWAEAQPVRNIYILWERRNVEGYKIQISENGTDWIDVYENETYPSDNDDYITLNETVTAKYLRLYMDKIHNASADPEETSWLTACLFEFQAYGETSEEWDNLSKINLALSATATASASETGNEPAKMNDGSRDSRWAHPQASSSWAKLAWNKKQTMQEFRIVWERLSAKSFYLETSENGTDWEKITKTFSTPTSANFEIKLSKPVTAKFLRLNVAEIEALGGWRAVSIFEFEVYAAGGMTHEEGAQEINGDLEGIEAEIAKLEAPEVAEGDTSIYMPEIEDVAVRFCADYEQVISEDGAIYAPLEEKTVKGFYELTEENGAAHKSKEFTVVVPGQHTEAEGANEKPPVIPELQEWHGLTGEFLCGAASQIIVNDGELLETANEFAKDFKEMTGFELLVLDNANGNTTPTAGDFCLSLTEERQGLGKEGYTLDIGDYITIEAENPVGAYWSTRTILQIVKQTGGIVPKGKVRDYPKYEVRAFMLDVGRKPITMESVKQYADNMAWYKMNSFQLHLSDNLIFTRDYATEEEAIEKAYAGFRLESDNIGPTTGKSATSEDLYYTKDEFRSFIEESRGKGIDVVPEFDMPAHALPFTRAFPEYMTLGGNNGPKGYLIEEIDLSKEGATDWAKSIWQEYMEGETPVFDQDVTIHIGTDEFHGSGGNESFRKFSDDMIKFVQGTGRTVRMWGSLSNKSGTTPVASEGVQLNIWETSYSDPKNMYQLGYDLINTLNTEGLYIVPSGTGVRGNSYSDYLSPTHLYNNFKPNKFGNFTLEAGDDQMLGACYAMWHDYIDTRANGISEYDSFDRFFEPLPYMSAKLWGEAEDRNYAEFTNLVEQTATAPGTTIYGETKSASSEIAEYKFDSDMKTDESANGYDLTEAQNVGETTVTGGKALQLKGGKSYVETPLDNIGPNAVLEMRVKMDADAAGEQILCESKLEFGAYGTYAFKASQINTGKVGFSREGYHYSFDYTLPKNEWHTLEFHGGQNNVALYVDGDLVDSDPDIYFENRPTAELSEVITQRGAKKVSTMRVPFGRIGSKTNSFKGEIDFVAVSSSKRISGNYGKISREGWTAAACSVHTEGPINNAIDGSNDTYWHQNWSSDTSLGTETTIHPEGAHWYEVTLPEAQTVARLTYLPRQNNVNGRIFEYSIVVEKEDGTKETVADHQTWAEDTSLKTADFSPVRAKKVKLLVHRSGGSHATIAELNLYGDTSVNGLKTTLSASVESYRDYKAADYTELSWNRFSEAYEMACELLEINSDVSEDYIAAYERLEDAASGLVQRSTDRRLFDLIKEGGQKKAEDYAKTGYDAYQAKVDAAKALADNASEEDKKTAADEIETAKETLVYIGELRRVKEEAEGKNLEDYVQDENLTAFQTAITAAETVINNADATVAEVEEALHNLREAEKKLVIDALAVKRKELLREVEKAQQKLEEIDRAEYTEASLKELEDAILAAGQEVEKDDTTEARLQELLDALLAVELVTKLDEKKAELDAAVKAKEAELAEINREEYTASSIRALETAIAEAKAELNKTDTTVAALTEKLEALDVTLERKDPNLPAKKEELQTEIEKAEQKLEGWRRGAYTEASVAALEAAIAEARAELDKEETTTAILQEKKEALNVTLEPKDAEVFAAKEGLETAITEAEEKLKEINPSDYTEESVAALQNAIAEAKAELEKTGATTDTIAAKLEALNMELTPKDPDVAAKKEELREKVKEAEKKLEGWRKEAYTKDSVAELEAAIAEAKAELEKSETTTAKLQEKLEALNVTLEPKDAEVFAAKEGLETAITEAEEKLKEINPSDYTEESVAALQNAIAEAKAELEKTGATTDTIAAKLEALNVGLTPKDPDLAAKKDELRAEVKEAEKKLEGWRKEAYTESSVAELEAAIAEAKAELEKSDTTTAKLQEKLDALKEKTLTPKDPEVFAAKEGLEVAVTEAEEKLKEINRQDYTKESVEALETAVEEAKALLETGSLDKIKAALAKLQGIRLETPAEVSKKQVLQQTINTAKNELKNSKYTSATLNILQGAITSAENLIKKGGSVEELQKAIDKIAAAKKGLKFIEYQVVFNSHGGSPVKTKPVVIGKKVTEPAKPKRAGYNFDGWYLEATYKTKYNFSRAVTKSFTLHAKWSKIETETPKFGDDATHTDQKEKITYKVVSASKKTAMVVKGLNKNAKSVRIPASVTIEGTVCKVIKIGKDAFKGYGKLTKVTLDKNIQMIDKNAFLNCKKLKTITLKGKALKTVKSKAFKNTAKNLKVKAPKGMKKAQKKKLLRILKKGGNKKIKVV